MQRQCLIDFLTMNLTLNQTYNAEIIGPEYGYLNAASLVGSFASYVRRKPKEIAEILQELIDTNQSFRSMPRLQEVMVKYKVKPKDQSVLLIPEKEGKEAVVLTEKEVDALPFPAFPAKSSSDCLKEVTFPSPEEEEASLDSISSLMENLQSVPGLDADEFLRGMNIILQKAIDQTDLRILTGKVQQLQLDLETSKEYSRLQDEEIERLKDCPPTELEKNKALIHVVREIKKHVLEFRNLPTHEKPRNITILVTTILRLMNGLESLETPHLKGE